LDSSRDVPGKEAALFAQRAVVSGRRARTRSGFPPPSCNNHEGERLPQVLDDLPHC